MGPLQTRVLKLLEDGRERTLEEILGELGLSLLASTLRVCISGLEKKGLVVVTRIRCKASRVRSAAASPPPTAVA